MSATTVAEAIRLTRGALQDAASAQSWRDAHPEAAQALHGKSLVYFNGAFSPPTRAHAQIAAALAREPSADMLWLDPEPAKPGKEQWQEETMEARLQMCELMASEVCPPGSAGVGSLRRDLGPELGSSAELFRTLRGLVGGPGQGKLYWALGADVFEGMKYWADKARACLQSGDTCDGLLIFVREGWTEERLWAAVRMLGEVPCEVRIRPMPEELLSLSSSDARRRLVQAQEVASPEARKEVDQVMLPSMASFCLAHQGLSAIYKRQVGCVGSPFCSKSCGQAAVVQEKQEIQAGKVATASDAVSRVSTHVQKRRRR